MVYFDFNNLSSSLDAIKTTEKRKQQQWTNRHPMMKRSIILHPHVKVNIKTSLSIQSIIHLYFKNLFHETYFTMLFILYLKVKRPPREYQDQIQMSYIVVKMERRRRLILTLSVCGQLCLDVQLLL